VTLFADSSALVKLYATEADSKLARNLVQVNTTVISSLAWVEVPAALWRKNRTGDLEAADVALLAQWFAADAQGTPTTAARFTSLAVTPAMLRQAVDTGCQARAAGLRRRTAGQCHRHPNHGRMRRVPMLRQGTSGRCRS